MDDEIEIRLFESSPPI